MRLIDADKLLKTTQTYDLVRALEQAKEVKAIPLEKVKQAREEMEIASYSKGYDEVLEILDSLIESEG